MRIGTRLLLPLTSLLTLVMLLVGAWLLRTREQRLMSESVRETRAYATALAIALEDAGGRERDLDRIIEKVSAEPGIYGLLLYDTVGRVLASAQPVDRRSGLPADYVRSLIARSEPALLRRTIGTARFLSVLRPLRRAEGGTSGALEVVQPLSSVEAELARTRVRFIWSGVLFVAVVALITLWMVHRIIARPLQEFIGATRAVGRGELNFRIPATRSGAEIEELRGEFNNMADRLESARTRENRQNEERIALERQLRHTEKLAAVGNLAAGLAHEIAAPLNVVAGRAEMLMRNTQPAEHRQRNLEIITQQISRITLIVRNLLDYARSHELQRRPVTLKSVVEGVVEFLDAELARAGVTVETSLPDIDVLADPDRLHQVILNLLLNSIQALDAVAGPRVVRIGARTEADGVEIEISDNGPGMSEAVAAQAFEPFFTTKSKQAGTGLGLAVARNIVEEHGGSIQAHAGPGGRFLIRLPAVQHA